MKNKKHIPLSRNERLANEILEIENNFSLTEKEKVERLDSIIQKIPIEDFLEIDKIINKINKK